MAETTTHQAAIEQMIADQQDQVRQERTTAKEADARPAPDPAHVTIGRRSDALRSAIQKSRSTDRVHLPELSKTAGQRIELKCRRLTVQELAASSSLPARTDELVTKLVSKSMQVVEQPNREWGIEREPMAETVNEMIEELYGSMEREALAAFFEFQAVVACVAVIDPDYRFVMTQAEVDAKPELNVLVWDIPQGDLDAIFAWALDQEAKAESTVLPFRNAAATGQPASSGSGPVVQAERSDQV